MIINTYTIHSLDSTTLYEIISPSHIKNTVALQFNVGSAQDPKGKEGLTHLVEHLILHVKNKSKTYVERELKGLYMNAKTNKERTVYTASSYMLTPEEICAWLIDSINIKPTLKECKEEILTIVSEISENESNGFDMVYEESIKESVGQYKEFVQYAHPVRGTVKSLKSITLKDVYDHIDIYYRDPAIVVVTTDNISKKGISYILTNSNLKFKTNKKDIETQSIKKVDLKNHRFDFTVGQTQVFGLSTVHTQGKKQDVFLNILKDYLANNWSSICNQYMRVESQLSYYVYADMEVNRNFSTLYIYYDSIPTYNKKAKDTCAGILDDVSKGKIDIKIFEATKQMLITAAHDIFKQEEVLAEDFLTTNMYKKKDEQFETNEDFIDAVKKVSVADFKKYVKGLF